MKKPFTVVQGNYVSNLEGITEGYSITQNNGSYQVIINVSSENIDNIFQSLCKKVETPGFLLLEHGTNENIEKQLRKSDSDPFHKDVYYLDGLNWESFLNIYIEFRELLINDGEINFGFGSHNGMDEVFIGPYKIFTIFTHEVEKYIEVLSYLGFEKYEAIKTVWDNFIDSTPGERMIIKHNGNDIYEMIEMLTKKGLYFAERRED